MTLAYGDNTLSTQEIVTAVVAGLVALGVVYRVPDAKPKP